MQKFGTRKSVLLITCLSLSGCASLPPFPEIYQCAWNGTPRAFYCVNTQTKARIKIEAQDPSMKAAQCVSADDFKKVQAWVSQVEQVANEKCR